MKKRLTIFAMILTLFSCGNKEEESGDMVSYTITYKVYYNQTGTIKTRTIDSTKEVYYNLRCHRGTNTLSFVTGSKFNQRSKYLESTSAPIEVLSFIKHEAFSPKTGRADNLDLTYVITLPGVREDVVLPYKINKLEWQEIANNGVKEGLKVNVLINGLEVFYISYDDEQE